MIKIDNEKIVEIALGFNKNKIPWHNHFILRKCIYNKSGKFQIVLENEQSEEVYFSEFEEQPAEKLKLLEELFFEQNRR